MNLLKKVKSPRRFRKPIESGIWTCYYCKKVVVEGISHRCIDLEKKFRQQKGRAPRID